MAKRKKTTQKTTGMKAAGARSLGDPALLADVRELIAAAREQTARVVKFQAADKGQMELYLRWLETHDSQAGEEPPLGLILCADKSSEHIELLQSGKSGIHVTQYLTELPPKELLEQKLHQSIQLARERLARNEQKRLAGDSPSDEEDQ